MRKIIFESIPLDSALQSYEKPIVEKVLQRYNTTLLQEIEGIPWHLAEALIHDTVFSIFKQARENLIPLGLQLIRKAERDYLKSGMTDEELSYVLAELYKDEEGKPLPTTEALTVLAKLIEVGGVYQADKTENYDFTKPLKAVFSSDSLWENDDYDCDLSDFVHSLTSLDLSFCRPPSRYAIRPIDEEQTIAWEKRMDLFFRFEDLCATLPTVGDNETVEQVNIYA